MCEGPEAMNMAAGYDPFWGTLWLIVGLVVAGLEILAIILKQTTLSQTIWTFYDNTWKRIVGILFFVVLLLHFFVPPFLPGWIVLVTAILFGWVFISGWLAHRKEASMSPKPQTYSVKKGAAKAAQGTGEAALGIAVAVGITALVAGVDFVLPLIDEAHELQSLGLPVIVAAAGVFLVRFLTNLWKVKRVELIGKKG